MKNKVKTLKTENTLYIQDTSAKFMWHEVRKMPLKRDDNVVQVHEGAKGNERTHKNMWYLMKRRFSWWRQEERHTIPN